MLLRLRSSPYCNQAKWRPLEEKNHPCLRCCVQVQSTEPAHAPHRSIQSIHLTAVRRGACGLNREPGCSSRSDPSQASASLGEAEEGSGQINTGESGDRLVNTDSFDKQGCWRKPFIRTDLILVLRPSSSSQAQHSAFAPILSPSPPGSAPAVASVEL